MPTSTMDAMTQPMVRWVFARMRAVIGFSGFS